MCLTVFDAYRHTLRLWRSQKNKILIKNDFERQLMIRKLKLSKGTCLVEEKNMIEIGIIAVQIFCCINPNPICIRSMLQSSRLFFFISGSFESRHPYESFCHAMAVHCKESIAFSEWCQNSNWHLVLTCQEIKVQGRSWTFRYLVNYWSWQKS